MLLRRLLWAWMTCIALLLSSFAASAQSAKPASPVVTAPVAGVDYEVIEGGKPWLPMAGKVEVAEVFAYWCPHCHHFAVPFDAWRARQPANVNVVFIPAAFDVDDALARAFFLASDRKLLPRTHQALFRAIHVDETLPRNPTTAELVPFFAKFGVPNAQALLDAPAMTARMQRTQAWLTAAGVNQTPTVIVAGRYRVLGSTQEIFLRNIDRVVAMARQQATR